jgi:peptidoglycan/xylan/chitin deacetylase (PgdA/CDA1 family)
MIRKRVAILTVITGMLCSILYLCQIQFETIQKQSCTTILVLHSVTNNNYIKPEQSGLYITKDNFKKLVKYFLDKKYSFVDTPKLKNILSGENNKLTRNDNILLTFDDGYEDNYLLAYPIIKDYNVKALISIIVKYTDEKIRLGNLKYLDWNEINEMIESGHIEIGSHSYDSHYYDNTFSKKSKPILNNEIYDIKDDKKQEYLNRVNNDFIQAKDIIYKKTGKNTNVFTYPYGKVSKIVSYIGEKHGFNIQISLKQGVNSNESDIKDLKRIVAKNNLAPNQIENKIKFYKMKNYFSNLFRNLGGIK